MTLSFCDVTFHGLEHSPALETLIHERTNWLQQFVPAGLAVHALGDIPHRHRREHATPCPPLHGPDRS